MFKYMDNTCCELEMAFKSEKEVHCVRRVLLPKGCERSCGGGNHPSA
jgi:hypothetical protein